MRMLLKNFSVIMSNVSAPMNVFIRHRTVLLEQSKPSSNSKYFTRQKVLRTGNGLFNILLNYHYIHAPSVYTI